MPEPDMTSAETHFAFGKNWEAYSKKIAENEIVEAVRGLSRLLDGERLEGSRVLDIGSGSGLHSLAALRLGAREVVAIDIDADSVSTTQAVLGELAPDSNWRVEHRSVFDLASSELGLFDVVYSWGVLHHTGDMFRAIRGAAGMCVPGGHFVFALYHRTWIDWFWLREKKWYTNASEAGQARARRVYYALFRTCMVLTGRSASRYVKEYRSNRGMAFDHDVHDWMGGWPYESATEPEVHELMASLGFERVRAFAYGKRWFGRRHGLLGSGCDEYVYRRQQTVDGQAT